MDASFSAATRAEDLKALAQGPLDLLVIGGGITGAGVARDAAMRGLSVGVVDAGDFADGTSSRSSRLIHGGLRYLEHGWFRLVFEASRERRTLLRIAPHLVRPLAFTFPAFRRGRVKRWQISAAVLLYDALALFRNAERHRWLSRAGVLRAEPQLREADLTGGARYWDAQCDDARLTVATLRSARRHGARCVSRVRVTALDRADGRVRGATCVDEAGGTAFHVHAHVVVNATGPWTDGLLRLDDAAAAPILRPTKGAHISVPRARLGNRGAITLTSPIDGRVMFVLPWGAVAIVGTTDTDWSGDPGTVAASREDVIYLLRSANAVFPNARLGEADVLAAWAGLRALLYAEGASASDVPREHRIDESASGLVTIAGGKLTTYRSMGAEVVDVVARRLYALDGRRVPARAASDVEPLPGGEVADLGGLAQQLEQDGTSPDLARHLAFTYGTEAVAIQRLTQDDRTLAEPLLPDGPWCGAEVVHHARRELAMDVSDVLERRMHAFHETADNGLGAAMRVASLLGAELGWDGDRVFAAVAAYERTVADMRASFRPPEAS